MTVREIYKLENEYLNCTNCRLHENRGGYVHFGMGHPDGSILVVVPQPAIREESSHTIEPELYDNSTLQERSRERILFSKIIVASNINKLQLYVTPAIMCPTAKGEQADEDEVIACSTRLKELISTYNPKILVLCGPIAYFSFYNEKAGNKPYGKLFDNGNKIIYYTRSLKSYIDLKISGEMAISDLGEMANEIFSHWKDIATLVNRS